jgi:hypothetical protein
MILQNKPNSRKTEMKLNFYSAKDYENKPRLRTPKNKPNQTQFQKARRRAKLDIFAAGENHIPANLPRISPWVFHRFKV